MTNTINTSPAISPPIMPRCSRFTGLATFQTMKKPTMVTSSAVTVEISALEMAKAFWNSSTKMMMKRSVSAAGKARKMAFCKNFPLTKLSLGSSARISEGMPMEMRLISVSCEGVRG